MTQRIAIIGHIGMHLASQIAEALKDIEQDVEIVDAEVHAIELRCPDPVPVPSARDLYLERRPRQAPRPRDQYNMRGAYRR